MDLNKNYYNILGVDKNADQDTIKKAFRKLAIKYHPDKNPDDKTSENLFKNVNEANQVLSDDKLRQQYDQQSPNGNNYNPYHQMGGFSFTSGFGGFGGDIFDIFNHFGFQQRRQEFHEQLDIRVNVIVTTADVYNNRPISVKYKKYVPCDSCEFTGFDRESESYDCDMCKGKGIDAYGRKCEYCVGRGKIYSAPCKTCNGEKVILKDVEFHINNIFKIRNSSTEYLQRYGHHSRHYRDKYGVLELNVIYEHDKRYRIEPDGLYYDIDLHYKDAIDGCEYNIDNLDGNTLKISIPEKTKDKDVLRLSNKGLLVNDKDRNNLLVKINIIIDYDKI